MHPGQIQGRQALLRVRPPELSPATAPIPRKPGLGLDIERSAPLLLAAPLFRKQRAGRLSLPSFTLEAHPDRQRGCGVRIALVSLAPSGGGARSRQFPAPPRATGDRPVSEPLFHGRPVLGASAGDRRS